MTTKPWDTSGQARKALQAIAADPQYGAAALSQPAVMTNLLKDLLPDEPREASLLVAAAQADLAGSLRGYVAQGLDPDTAVSLTATSFVNSTSHTQEACNWVVSEFALALGLRAPAARFDPTAPPPPAPTAVAAPPAPSVPSAAVAQPGQPGQQAWPVAPNTPVNQPAAPPPYQPVAPNPWQPSPWAVPPPPTSQARPGRGASIAAGLVGLVGALFVLIACFVPFEKYPGQSSFGILTGHHGLPASFTFWYAAEPIGVLLVAVVAGIALLATSRSGRLRGLLPGMFLAFGFQTFLLFGGYVFTVLPSSARQPGGSIGLLGGLVLLFAGVLGLIGATRPDPAHASGPSTPGSAVPRPGSTGT